MSEATPRPWEFRDGPYGWDRGLFPAGAKPDWNNGIFVNSGHSSGDPTEADEAFIVAAVNSFEAAEALAEAAAASTTVWKRDDVEVAQNSLRTALAAYHVARED